MALYISHESRLHQPGCILSFSGAQVQKRQSCMVISQQHSTYGVITGQDSRAGGVLKGTALM